ncbi:MAG: metallophosphoesterase [Polyangiaceae bacterium]
MRLRRKLTLTLWALASTFAAGNAFAAGLFARGPFLQSLGKTAVTIKLDLLTPEPVTVEVTGPDGVAKKVEATDPRRFHAVRVEGLTPSTAYRYRVLAGAAATATASEEGHFTTAPDDARPFKIVTYGDSRSDPAAHAAVIRAIEGTPSDFLLHTGDMVAIGAEEDDWRGFFEVENKLLRDRCVFASVGNHELAGEKGVGAATFLRYFATADDAGKDMPKLWGSFRWSNARFFLLNAMDAWTGEERAWLKDELDRAAAEPGLVHRIAVLHHGPYSSGPHGGNDRLHENGVTQLLKDGKIDLIVAGHDHAYERGTGDGLKYVVSGGAGAPLYPRKKRSPETAVYESVHHFVELSFDGDKVGLVAKRASGSVIEKCGFAAHGPWECEKAGAGPGTSAAPASSAGPAGIQTSSACACSAPGSGSVPTGAVGLAAMAGLVLASAGRRSRRRR